MTCSRDHGHCCYRNYIIEESNYLIKESNYLITTNQLYNYDESIIKIQTLVIGDDAEVAASQELPGTLAVR